MPDCEFQSRESSRRMSDGNPSLDLELPADRFQVIYQLANCQFFGPRLGGRPPCAAGTDVQSLANAGQRLGKISARMRSRGIEIGMRTDKRARTVTCL
jgi:hypothetical protein